MKGEALFPFQRTPTQNKKAKQCHATILAAGCCVSAVRVDVGKAEVTRVGDCSNRMLLSPTGKKCRGNHMALYASGYDPSTAALDSYQCPYGHVCRCWRPGMVC